MRIGPLPTGEQHHLVATAGPRVLQGVFEHAAPVAAPTMRGQRNHMLDYAERTSAACEIRNGRERTARRKQRFHLADDDIEIVAGEQPGEDFLRDPAWH